MNSRKIFQVVFFAIIISAIDFAVLRLSGGFRAYGAAISYLLTNLIFVFIAAKTGSNGVVAAQPIFRLAFYALIAPYPLSNALCVMVGTLAGEAVVLFSKRKKSLATSSIAYFLFNIACAFSICITDFSFVYSDSLPFSLGAVAIAAIASYVIARLALISALRRAGIEK